MRTIDCYAYSSRIRMVDPAQKAAFTLIVMLLCLLLNRPAVGLLAALWMWGLATIWAGVPAWVFGRLLLVEGLFLLLAVAGVAASVSLSPPAGASWSWQIGPLWVASGPPYVESAAYLACRALGGAAAMNFLALTTPLVDLVDLMRRLRAPSVVVELMMLMYRFAFTLFESLVRIRIAQESRVGYVDLGRALESSSLLASRLFIDAYQRSRRLQVALESRGFEGDLRVLSIPHRGEPLLHCVACVVIASLLVARLWI